MATQTNATWQSESVLVAAEQSEIKRMLDELEKEIRRLEEEVKSLSARLAPISLPELARPSATNSNPQQPHSEIVNYVNAMRVKLTEVNIFLSDVKQRLEV